MCGSGYNNVWDGRILRGLRSTSHERPTGSADSEIANVRQNKITGAHCLRLAGPAPKVSTTATKAQKGVSARALGAADASKTCSSHVRQAA
eukprot:2041167-Pyramimonas_sp.AAC.1